MSMFRCVQKDWHDQRLVKTTFVAVAKRLSFQIWDSDGMVDDAISRKSNVIFDVRVALASGWLQAAQINRTVHGVNLVATNWYVGGLGAET